MESLTIDRAVVLTSAAIFSPPESRRPGHPLTLVGGLTLLHRTLLTLQRGNIGRLIVVAGEESESLRRQLQQDRRITAEVRWLPIREFPPSDPRTWEVLSAMLGGPYLLAGGSAVFPPSLVVRLREEGGQGGAVVVVRDRPLQRTARERPGEEVSPPGVVIASPSQENPTFVPHTQGGGVVTLEAAQATALTIDLAVIPQGFTSPGWATLQDSPYPIQAALERAVRQGQARLLPLASDWYLEVPRGPADKVAEAVAQAEWTLLRSLKGGLEGFVDRYFNRRCSKWLTRLLLRTPLTPNAITFLSAAIGLLAAVAFAMGGYAAGIIGAVLFQLSAIIDCCDGEVARIKFQESPLGEQLDVALDNVVHVCLFAGMAWAASKTWGSFAFWLGGLAIVGDLASFVVVKKAATVRDALDSGIRRQVDAILNNLASRDFSVLILALALLGRVEWFLLLAAIGSNIFWPVLAWRLNSAPSLKESR